MIIRNSNDDDVNEKFKLKTEHSFFIKLFTGTFELSNFRT